MLYIGVDLSDRFFDTCITNSYGDVITRNRFDFDHDGFCSFVKLIQEHQTDTQEGVVGLENPRSRLVDFLTQRGYTVVLTNPKSISKYRESRRPSKAKSDQADAQIIADYVREHHKNLRSIQVPDEAVRELGLLLEDRDRLIQQRVRFSNQLTSTLKEYFPQALDAFGSIDNKCAIKFLKRVDTFQQVKSLSGKQQEQLLRECGCYRQDSKERFYQAMSKPLSHVSQAVVNAKVRLKNIILSHLDQLIQQIDEYDRQIQEMMDDTPDSDIFRSLPGVDYILGAKLLVLYSSRNFVDASEAQEFWGTCPYTIQSGQTRIIRFRKGTSKFGRNTFQQFAFCSIRYSNWAKKFYVKKRNEGKKSQHALRCLANSWVKITFAMWRSKTPYDESRHLASIAGHLINQPAFVIRD